MNDISDQTAAFHLDRGGGALFDAAGNRFDPLARCWSRSGLHHQVGRIPGARVDAVEAATWLQRESGHALRVPVGVIGPRDASPAQLACAEHVGAGLARIGIAVICGGRNGVMQAVCEGVSRGGGVSIGVLPDPDAGLANPHATYVLATGLGEARNAVIARAALCLCVIGDSYGTLSEVALGLQFGKRVFGLEGAADVQGVAQFVHADEALQAIALEIIAGHGRAAMGCDSSC
ncbi:MAG: hypothetical protein ABJC33_00810 [Betaproteobacteria bacterium]